MEVLTEIVMPYEHVSKKDYFKAAVLWVIARNKKPTVRRAEKGEKSTLEDEEICKVIAEAVPGHMSYLMDLAIRTNIHEYVLTNTNYSLEEKVSKVADGIEGFVIY